MSDIRFRAWDGDAGCFSYSDVENDNYVWGFYEGQLTAWAIVKNPGSLDEPPHPESVELAAPQDFTGLKDKFGVPIYEGDVVKKINDNLRSTYSHINPPKIGDVFVVMKLISGYTLIQVKRYGKPGDDLSNIHGNVGNYDFWNGASTGAEVIGNVHEHPELLET